MVYARFVNIMSSSLSIADTVRVAFLAWLELPENRNRTRFTEERYLEYKALRAPFGDW